QLPGVTIPTRPAVRQGHRPQDHPPGQAVAVLAAGAGVDGQLPTMGCEPAAVLDRLPAGHDGAGPRLADRECDHGLPSSPRGIFISLRAASSGERWVSWYRATRFHQPRSAPWACRATAWGGLRRDRAAST